MVRLLTSIEDFTSASDNRSIKFKMSSEGVHFVVLYISSCIGDVQYYVYPKLRSPLWQKKKKSYDHLCGRHIDHIYIDLNIIICSWTLLFDFTSSMRDFAIMRKLWMPMWYGWYIWILHPLSQAVGHLSSLLNLFQAACPQHQENLMQVRQRWYTNGRVQIADSCAVPILRKNSDRISCSKLG